MPMLAMKVTAVAEHPDADTLTVYTFEAPGRPPVQIVANAEHTYVMGDVAMVARAIRPHPLKVILETARFDAGRTVSAARAAVDGGAAFVKTSTGFDPVGGATIDAVARLRRAVGPSFGVKASGGIRTAEQARAMIAAGATRIGTSRGPALLGGTSRTPE